MAGQRSRARVAVAAGAPRCAEEGIPLLRAPREGQDIVADYGSFGLDVAPSSARLLRDKLKRRGVLPTRSSGSSPTASGDERRAWYHAPAAGQRRRRHLRHHGR